MSKKPVQLTPSLELFWKSVEIIKNNVGVYLVLYVLPFLLIGFGAARNNPVDNMSGYMTVVGLGSIVSLLLYPPLVYTYTQTAKGKSVTISEAFKNGYPKFLPLLGVSILAGLAILIGLILFIVPGIIMLRRYLLASYYVMDQNLGVMDALKRSAADSKQYSGWVYGILGVNLLFGLLGAIPVIGAVVGSILQVLYSVAPALRYHEIKKAVKA